MIFDLPPQEYFARWHKIKILKAPLGLKNIDFDPNKPKDTYLMQGFIEVEIGVAPYRTQFLVNNTQAKKKKYVIKHHVTITMYTAMGDTLKSMGTEIYQMNGNYRMCDKGKIIVILSWTKLTKNTNFQGKQRILLLQ